jgi:hypothetical protein
MALKSNRPNTKNFSVSERAARVLETIAKLFDETRIVDKIDRPVDEALQTFTLEVDLPVSREIFHSTMAQFVEAIYRNLGMFPKPDTLSAALALLEAHYEGIIDSGYAGARMEANNDEAGGLTGVLHRFAEAIKLHEREKYIGSIFIRHIDPGDWDLQCEIVARIVDKLGPYLPQSLAGSAPSQLTDAIPALFSISRNSRLILEQMYASHEE